MTISGYSTRGKDILGLNSFVSDIDGLPYATLSYANGYGYKPRGVITAEELGELHESHFVFVS